VFFKGAANLREGPRTGSGGGEVGDMGVFAGVSYVGFPARNQHVTRFRYPPLHYNARESSNDRGGWFGEGGVSTTSCVPGYRQFEHPTIISHPQHRTSTNLNTLGANIEQGTIVVSSDYMVLTFWHF
jgi:hypothetical protein